MNYSILAKIIAIIGLVLMPTGMVGGMITHSFVLTVIGIIGFSVSLIGLWIMIVWELY